MMSSTFSIMSKMYKIHVCAGENWYVFFIKNMGAWHAFRGVGDTPMWSRFIVNVNEHPEDLERVH